MKCPYCGSDTSNVLESRISADLISIPRRRAYAEWTKRLTTYERVEGLELTILKKNGERQPFDREKMRKGLMKATWKRPVSIEAIEELISSVERALLLRESTEIRSWEVGELVIEKLEQLDSVSYLLFACVYRDFQSIQDFEKEIQRLKKTKEPAKKSQKKTVDQSSGVKIGSKKGRGIKKLLGARHQKGFLQ